MNNRIESHKNIYQIYDEIVSKEYTLFLTHIKNYSLLQALYGRECLTLVLHQLKKILSSFLNEKEYLFSFEEDSFLLFINSHDPYCMIHKIYQIDQGIEENDFSYLKHSLALSFGIVFLHSQIPFHEAVDHASFTIKNSKDRLKYNTTFDFYDALEEERQKHDFKWMPILMDALRNHEFEIYLQAKVNASSHQIEGCEALLRWNHKGAFIPLSDFMPIIDQNAFIRQIDLFVFEEVCHVLTRWKNEDQKLLPISLNISKASFEDGFYYLKEIESITKQFDLDKTLIEFELSENICFTDTQRLRKFLTLLKAYGFHCSLDDFGSGYSSFYSLTYLPIETIKLDSSFCLGLWNAKKEILFNSLLNLFKQLGFHIVVEGVESKEAVAFLQNYPTVLLQGFYFSKPLKIQQFEEKYQKKRIN